MANFDFNYRNVIDSLQRMEYGFRDMYYYIFSSVFVFGNLFLPWFLHQFNLGGNRFLPIYSFVLIGTVFCGYKVGVSVSILSPLVNYWATGMPSYEMIFPIVFKGIIFVLVLDFVMKSKGHLNQYVGVVFAVIFYQVLGAMFEIFYFENFSRGVLGLVVGWPGIIIQIIIGLLLVGGLFGKKKYA